MQKAIYINNTSDNLAYVLAIAPAEFAGEHDGRTYFVIEDYEEPPVTDAMDKHYPIYNKEKQEFGYITESWTTTASKHLLDVTNLKAELAEEIAKTQELETALQEAIMEITTMMGEIYELIFPSDDTETTEDESVE